MTLPFQKPAAYLSPPAPCWIVRRPPSGRPAEPDTIEIVFVGHMLRAELEAAVERLVAWPWPFGADDPIGDRVTILADMHADPVGVRLTSDALTLTSVLAIVVDIFGAGIVCQALTPRHNGGMHHSKG